MSKQSKQPSPEPAGAEFPEGPSESLVVAGCNQEELRERAYFYWQARGCPFGSPEEDWFRAERESIGPKAVAAAH